MKRRNPPVRIPKPPQIRGVRVMTTASGMPAAEPIAPQKMRGAQKMHSAGFTLIEMMVSLVVAAGLLVSIAMAVGSLAGSYGEAWAERQMKDTVGNALRILGRDIAAAGRGTPADLFGLGPIEMFQYQTELQWLYNNLIRDINSTSAADELWLSGAGMDGSPTSERAMVVAGFNNMTNTLTVGRYDGPGIGNNYVSPVTTTSDPESPTEFAGFNLGAGIAPLYATVMHPSAAWRSAAPLPVLNLTPVLNAFNEVYQFQIQLGNPLALTQTPRAGDLVWFVRPVKNTDGTFTAPQHMQQARWYVVPDVNDPQIGTLYRQLVADPTVPASASPTQDGVPILDNVVDFQVAFQVWRCGANAPAWVDNLLDPVAGTGEFSGAPYLNGTNYAALADRLLALRARLMAVRITLLVREATPHAGAFNNLFGGGAPSFQSEDRVLSGLDDRYRYFLIQQVYDPELLRLSTSAEDPTEVFPRVRSFATDQATVDPASGACRGRRMQ